jgi:hypothetical protein
MIASIFGLRLLGGAKKAMLVVAHTKDCARINLAEDGSDSQKEQESDASLNEL